MNSLRIFPLLLVRTLMSPSSVQSPIAWNVTSSKYGNSYLLVIFLSLVGITFLALSSLTLHMWSLVFSQRLKETLMQICGSLSLNGSLLSISHKFQPSQYPWILESVSWAQQDHVLVPTCYATIQQVFPDRKLSQLHSTSHAGIIVFCYFLSSVWKQWFHVFFWFYKYFH